MDIVLDTPGVYYFVSDVVNLVGNACKAGAKIKVTVVGGNEEKGEGQPDLESDDEEGIKTTPPTSDGEQFFPCSTFWFTVAAQAF